MNRRQRRATTNPGHRRVQQAARCPDCTADVTVVEIAPRHYRGVVEHDETCPWLAAFRRNGGLGLRFR